MRRPRLLPKSLDSMTIELSTLAKLLQFYPDEIVEWLGPRAIRRDRKGRQTVRWKDAKSLGTPAQRAKVVALLRREVVPGASKYWLTGYAVAREWHPQRNGDLEPWMMRYASKRRVWWKCPEGPDHEWQTAVGNRTVLANRCPFCVGRRVSVTNSVASVAPATAAYWHPRKNGTLRPEDVSVHSTRVVWWKCPKGPDHVFRSMVSDRVNGVPCLFCSSDRVSVTNSLSTRAPAFARQWHPTKNGRLRPRDVTVASSVRVWWQCPKGSDHVWQTAVSSRTTSGSGCPMCDGAKASATNNLAVLMPTVAKDWHPTKNGALRPKHVMVGAKAVVWWRCSRDRTHEWQNSVYQRAYKSAGCPYCSHRLIREDNSLAASHPEVAAEWHPTKNAGLRPDQVAPFTSRYAYWRCGVDPRHVWRASIANRTHLHTGCPYCAGKKVDRSNSLAALRPDVAREWHPTLNDFTPSDVTAQSKKRAWWRCPNGPDHEWQTMVQSRGGPTKSGCPFCAGKRLSVTNSLRARYPAIAKEWDVKANGGVTAREVLAGTSMRAHWVCREGHRWEAAVISRTWTGARCALCARASMKKSARRR